MPTRRFEGRSLEDALARASSEVGSDARVVGAERVRSGGIGGFFARERVEIEVELDDMPAAPDAPEPPASLLDLADRVSSVESREARTTIHSDPPVSRRAKAHTPPPPPPPPPPPAEEPASTPTNVAPDSIDTGTPVIVGAPPTPLPLVPHVSTETPTFAEILERITAETGGRDEKAEAVATTPVAPAPPVAEQHLVAEAPVPAPTSPPPVQLIVRPAPPAPLAFPRPTESGGPLARLGLPPELEPTGPDLRDALVAQLASLPQPPPLPSSRGTVIAVVGAPGLAYQAARTIRGRVATDAAIATFSRRPSSDDGIDEVSDQRRAWRRRPGPTVAVVDAPVGRPTGWASEALCALEPTAVWGVVEASRKVEDVAAWSASLGGVDALCLSGLDDTVSPAAALRTGLPVALLEGQPATAERWADVLLARLPEADHALKEPACSDR